MKERIEYIVIVAGLAAAFAAVIFNIIWKGFAP